MIDLRIITAAEAAERLRTMGMKVSPDTIREGIEQNRFSFGDVIRSKNGNPICFVYEKKLMEWASDKGFES